MDQNWGPSTKWEKELESLKNLRKEETFFGRKGTFNYKNFFGRNLP